MMNFESFDALRGREWSGGRLFYPDPRYNFGRIPATIERALGLKPSFGEPLPEPAFRQSGVSSKVILLLVDGFGLRFFEKFRDELPFLRRFAERGVVSALSSQFPSTTAAHITTLHYGQPLSQHGVYEWFYYEPSVGAVIAPLPMSFAGDPRPNRVPKSGVSLDDILPRKTFYQSLDDRGVRCRAIQSADISKSAYSGHALRGAELRPTRSLPEGIDALATWLESSEEPGYSFMYEEAVDLRSHRTGPDSPEVDAEIRRVFGLLEERLTPVLEAAKDWTLFLTADHGHVETDPANCFYLNKEIPDISETFVSDPRSGKILFAGSARDLFLHVRKERLGHVRYLLSEKLHGRAEVLITGEHMEPLFGPGPYSERFLSRLGNLVILPYAGQSVFWHEPGKFEMKFRGHHGGLTASELHSIFLAQSDK